MSDLAIINLKMSKIATTKFPVLEIIQNRWSPRSFSDKQLSVDELNTLFEAASWAFSANNAQPWTYIYAFKGSEGFEKLVNCLMPGNQPWAKNASVLMLSVANKMMGERPYHVAKHDVGAANATLALQATSMGIYSHLMGGFSAEKAIETFGIDTEKQEPIVMIALGYLGEAEKLEEPFLSRELAPRTRKPLEEFTKPA
jgi:nitroreductase